MRNKRFSFLLISVVLIFAVSKLDSLTMKDIEENSSMDVYYVGHDASRYYFWGGPAGGPQIKLDYARTPNIDKIVGYHITRFSPSGELKYTSRVPIKGILFGSNYKIMEDDKGVIYLIHYTYEGYGRGDSYGYDSLGNLMWKVKGGMPIYTEPAGIFQKDDGTKLSFGYHMGDFELFHFDMTGRKDKVILKNRDFSPRHKLSLPYDSRNWRVARIGEDRFLAVAIKSSVDRDKLFNMKTIGDSIHIISFLVNSEGEILDSVNLDNAEGKAVILEVDTSSIGTAYYFRKCDYFKMPDSSLFFVFSPQPKMVNGNYAANFLLYIVKFSKNGKLVPLKHKPKVLPLSSLSSGYRIKGFSFRGEYWDYAVDSLGNFYVEIRKYSLKRK